MPTAKITISFETDQLPDINELHNAGTSLEDYFWEMFATYTIEDLADEYGPIDISAKVVRRKSNA